MSKLSHKLLKNVLFCRSKFQLHFGLWLHFTEKSKIEYATKLDLLLYVIWSKYLPAVTGSLVTISPQRKCFLFTTLFELCTNYCRHLSKNQTRLEFMTMLIYLADTGRTFYGFNIHVLSKFEDELCADFRLF